MQKILKNWGATLSACLLLVLIGTLLFLDGFEILALQAGTRLLNLLFAVSLATYALAVVFPGVVRYRGALRGFAAGELLVLLGLAVVQLFTTWAYIPFLSEWELCAVVGLAIWMRGVTQTVRAYISNADVQNRLPLWRLLVAALISAVGVWQMVAPIISDRDFIFVIALAAVALGLIFAALTLRNYRATADVRAAKKQEKLLRKAQEAALLAEQHAQAANENEVAVQADVDAIAGKSEASDEKG